MQHPSESPRLRRVAWGSLLALSASLAMTSGTAVSAQQDLLGPHLHPPSDIVSTYRLVPEPGNDILLSNAFVEVTVQGHRIVNFRTTTRAKRLNRTFDWIADMQRGTYRTFQQFGRPGELERVQEFLRSRGYRNPFPTREPNPIVAHVAGHRGPFAFFLRPAPPYIPMRVASAFYRTGTARPIASKATHLTAVQEGGPCNCCPTCECGGVWTARGQTRDLFGYGFLLNYTDARVLWNSSFSRPEWNECNFETWSGLTWCTALAPTDLGTHWYTAGCYDYGDHGPFDRYGSSQTTGVYYNYDFADDEQGTWVLHEVLAGVNGSQNFATQRWEAGGEFSSLLGTGTFSEFGSNSCTM